MSGILFGIVIVTIFASLAWVVSVMRQRVLPSSLPALFAVNDAGETRNDKVVVKSPES